MIDPSFDTVVTPYPPTMKELEEKYRELEKALQTKTDDWKFVSSQAQKYAAQINLFEDALKENPWDFDADTLNDLARYFDLTLDKEYMVYITVRFSGNVTVPMDYDIDDLENELQAEISKGYYSNHSVEIDLMEEEMDISVEEV